MFLVSKNGMHVTKVKDISMELDYTDSAKEHARELRKQVMDKAYNFGSTANAEREADRRITLYLKDQPLICRIFVNGKYLFGEYDNVDEGKSVYKGILHALQTHEHYCDMSILS